MIIMRLENKVAIITGSSSGIGLTIAKGYVKNGANITICGTNAEKVNRAKEEILKEFKDAKVLALKVDVSKTEDVTKLFQETYKEYGHIDILINNAGIAPAKNLEETSDEEFINVLNINTVGTFKCTREAVKYMKDNGGSIINTSSFVSLYGSPSQSAYSASKPEFDS